MQVYTVKSSTLAGLGGGGSKGIGGTITGSTGVPGPTSGEKVGPEVPGSPK